MKKCERCGKDFLGSKVIDGKRRLFNNRKYCLDCSPFGMHNTRDLKGISYFSNRAPRKCKGCGREYIYKGSLCPNCSNKRKHKDRVEKIRTIVGDSCWICGYNKSERNMCFHHIDPSEKKMKLSCRERSQRSWNSIIEEMVKCVFICNRCHGEVHDGIILKEKIKELHKGFWTKTKIEDLNSLGIKLNKRKSSICKSCGGPLSYGTKNSLCRKCFTIKRRKIDRPSLSVLRSQIDEFGYSETGRRYGVSDNSIRKWVLS